MKSELQNWFVTTDQERISNDDVVTSALAIERHFNADYNLQIQLSPRNISKIRQVNEVQANCNKLYSTAGLILSEAQLANTENLLAGDAGERLVDQLVRKVVNSSNAVFRDVVLPYEYGQQHSFFDNQIDNLIVTSTGVYCIEVKTRSLSRGTFDLKNLAPNIYDQITYHKKAVITALEGAGFSVQPNLVKNIIVIVARSGEQEFRINNQADLSGYGACVTDLGHLSMQISKGFDQCSLPTWQISRIEEIISGSRIVSRRTYPNNVRFCLTQPKLDKLIQLEQAVQWHVPLEQNVTYNSALNELSMRGLSCSQQNFFWLIMGRLFAQGQTQISVSVKDLKKAANYRSRNSVFLAKSLHELAELMTRMPLFQQVDCNSGKLTVTICNQFLPQFNQYSSAFTSWNYQLFSQIKHSYAKTLFRKFVQLAGDGSYQVSLKDLRQLLGVAESYRNHFVVKQIDIAILHLAPFFGHLTYELERGRSNEIVGITFFFDKANPEELLAFEGKKTYLHNISTNSALSPQEKKLAKEIFEKNFFS